MAWPSSSRLSEASGTTISIIQATARYIILHSTGYELLALLKKITPDNPLAVKAELALTEQFSATLTAPIPATTGSTH